MLLASVWSDRLRRVRRHEADQDQAPSVNFDLPPMTFNKLGKCKAHSPLFVYPSYAVLRHRIE